MIRSVASHKFLYLINESTRFEFLVLKHKKLYINVVTISKMKKCLFIKYKNMTTLNDMY